MGREGERAGSIPLYFMQGDFLFMGGAVEMSHKRVLWDSHTNLCEAQWGAAQSSLLVEGVRKDGVQPMFCTYIVSFPVTHPYCPLCTRGYHVGRKGQEVEQQC